MQKMNIINSVSILEIYVRKVTLHVVVLPLLLQEHVQTGKTNHPDFVFEPHYRQTNSLLSTKSPASSVLFSFTQHFN